MNALRPATATVLALWLGFLACVLGCSQPVLASTPSQTQIAAPKLTINQSDTEKMADAGPCCHHGHKSSDKNNLSLNISCCPLDATVIQKQDPASSKSSHPHAVALMPFIFTPSFQLVAGNGTNVAPVRHPAGRDVLLQIHGLRI
jgi:hypothetical protein